MKNLIETIKTHPEHFKKLSCKVLLFTQYNCQQETELQDLYSEQDFILYVLSGRRVFYQPGHAYEMDAGKCIYSKKGGWLSQKETGEDWSVIIFFLPDNYMRQFFNEYRPLFPLGDIRKKVSGQMINLEVNEITRSLFHSMVPYFTQSPPPPETLLELKFRELLVNLLINPENREFLSRVSMIADAQEQSLATVMDANFTYNISLEEFAKLSHLSLASFKREFKKTFRTTPGKWLVEKRLDYANRLIVTSSKRINDIAFESGFENNAHFSRVFREKFGSSPLQYRRQFLPAPVLS